MLPFANLTGDDGEDYFSDGHLLTLQAEIAQEVARQIQLTFANRPENASRQATLAPNALQAYDLYLKGRYFWNKRTNPGFQQAIEYFQQAIAKDPTDARASAGLSDSYALLSGHSLTPQSETMPKARAAALKVVQLDDWRKRTLLSHWLRNYDWDWQKAEKDRTQHIGPDAMMGAYVGMGKREESFDGWKRRTRTTPIP